MDVTFAVARQIARVTPSGAIRILATLPAPADGGTNTPVLGLPLAAGIVRTPDGTLYVLYATGTPDLTGLWRMRPGGEPHRIAALPADALPNGLALDPSTRTFYITDDVLGTIWRVPPPGAPPPPGPPAPNWPPAGFMGADGVKVHRGAVWATNLDKGTLLRIPIRHDGRAGRSETGPPAWPASTTSPSSATATGSWPRSTSPARSRSSSPTAATPSC